MKNFKDNFSKQSDIYVKYRPHYPKALYAFLASLTEHHTCVWDCGTGNGQAATGLAEFYDQVIATDPSEQQIKNSLQHHKVTYCVETAENNSIPTRSIDLLTIANALHWFDFDAFYKEATRVLKPNGIIAAWAYGNPVISPEVDKIIRYFHDHTLDEYWRAENRFVEAEYTTIPFPFELIDAPAFSYKSSMTLADLVGYLNTWSATQRFIRENNFNPTATIFEELRAAWKNADEKKELTWKVILKVGRCASTSLSVTL